MLSYTKRFTPRIILGALAFSFVALLPSLSSGQGIYGILRFGNGFSRGSRDLIATTVVKPNATDSTFTSTYGSYGQGIYIHAGAGIRLGQVIDFELCLGYHHGKKFSFGNDYGSGTSKTQTSVRGSTFILNPSIYIHQRGEDFIIRPYGRWGMLLAIPRLKVEHSRTVLDNEVMAYTVRASSGIELGLNGAFGVEININPMMAVMVEAFASRLVMYPDRFNFTNFKQSAEGVSPTAALDDRFTYYTAAFNREPYRRKGYLSADRATFNTWGFNLGLKIRLTP